MLETMGEDYVRTARAKGLTERHVIVKHGLRAALTPIVTIFGLDLGLLLGGAVLTETTFSLPGLGKYAVDAIAATTCRRCSGVTMVAAFFIVLANLIVDVLYAVVDPRVRLHDARHRTRGQSTRGSRRRLPGLRDLRVHFPTDDGLVKSVDGLSFSLERARRSASWASPAPASR